MTAEQLNELLDACEFRAEEGLTASEAWGDEDHDDYASMQTMLIQCRDALRDIVSVCQERHPKLTDTQIRDTIVRQTGTGC